MSSLARRLQTRIFERQGRRKLPVLHETTGNVMTWLWPRRPGQLAYFGNPPQPVTADTKHPLLQPIIDILADDARKRATT